MKPVLVLLLAFGLVAGCKGSEDVKCKDGSAVHGVVRRGACSHHGGVQK